MSNTLNKSVKTINKEENKSIPKGATILSEEERIVIEEIENGYLVRKTVEYRYQAKDKDYPDYLSINKTWYTKTNPVEQMKTPIAELL